MKFSLQNPTLTDPLTDTRGWAASRQPGNYYAWTQYVTPDVRLAFAQEIELGDGVRLQVYRGVPKPELLYRIDFGTTTPTRLLNHTASFSLFWSFGQDAGGSKVVDWRFRDRLVEIHCWVDKRSYLAVLRQPHYTETNFTFWSR